MTRTASVVALTIGLVLVALGVYAGSFSQTILYLLLGGGLLVAAGLGTTFYPVSRRPS